MAIFSRRTLQRLINENSSFLTKKQTKSHVDKLNNGDLSAEWEVLLLNVFSKIGKIEHENNYNGKKPDIHFISTDNKINFLADIVTVSDKGIDGKNPINQFVEKLRKVIHENKLFGNWNYKVGDNYKEAARFGKRLELKLPALSRFNTEIFNKDFEDFILKVKTNPKCRREYQVKSESVDILISYNPSENWTTTGGHLSYKQLRNRNDLIQNPIYNNLERKYEQLIKTGYKGDLGIIVCDGGCEYLRRSLNIINYFLETHPQISFILMFDIEQQFGHDAYNQIKVYFEKGQSISKEVEVFLSNLHKYAETLFPYPQNNAVNAINLLKVSLHKGESFYGGSSRTKNKIKLSARTVLDLLAGKLTYDNFPKTYKDYFRDAIDEGKLISDVEIESAPDENDDDWLIFKFGEPDPAVKPFQVPNKPIK